MADTGWLNPGNVRTNNSLAGTVNWTNINNILASDNSYASVTMSIGAVAYAIYAWNYGASVPLDAAITGVELRFEHHRTSGTASGGTFALYRDAQNNNTGPDEEADFGEQSSSASFAPNNTASDVAVVGGSSSTLWNLSLTPADVNASTFGPVVLGLFGFDFANNTVLNADALQIRIHYEALEAPANTVAPVASSSNPYVGTTASVTNGTWTGNPSPSFSYQWYNDNGAVSGATSNTYEFDDTDIGLEVWCVVTGTNTEGTDDAESNHLGPISPAPVSEGPNSPDSGVNTDNSGSSITWSNPGNVVSSNNARATCTVNGTTASDFLDVLDFDFSTVGNNDDVIEVRVSIERLRSGGSTGQVRDNTVQLIINGTATGANMADTGTNWPTTEAAVTYTFDVSGLGYKGADFKAATTGVRIAVQGNTAGANRAANVDHVTMEIDYLEVPPGVVTFDGPNINNFTETRDVAITPVDVSDRFSDSEDEELSFSAVGSWPTGITVTSAGVIQGTPTDGGNYTGLGVRATNESEDTEDSNTFSIFVEAPPGVVNFDGPSIEDITAPEAEALTPIDVSDRFSDSEDEELTFSAVGDWPPGFEVTSTGVIQGTSYEVGVYSPLAVRATNESSDTEDSNEFSVTVVAPTGSVYDHNRIIGAASYNRLAGLTGSAAPSALVATNKAGYLWGVGYGDRGYGQSTPALTAALKDRGIPAWTELQGVLAGLCTWQEFSPTLSPYAVEVAEDSPIGWWRLGDPAQFVDAGIANAGFETGDFGTWATVGSTAGDTWSVSSEEAHSGTYSLRVDVGVDTDGQSRRFITAVSGSGLVGRICRARGWIKRTSGSGSGQVVVIFRNGGTLLGGSLVSTGVSSSDWTQVEVTGPVPADCNRIDFEFRGGNGGTYFFDDAELYLLDVAGDEIADNDLIFTGTYALEQNGALINDSDTAVQFTSSTTQGDDEAAFALGKVDFSLETWLKFTSTEFSTAIAIRNKAAPTSSNIQVILTTSRFSEGDISAETWAWSDSATRVRTSEPMNDGEWHHVVTTYRASQNALRLYIDGELIDARYQGSASFSSADCTVTIGSNVSGIQPFDGEMDEVAFYDQELTPGRILDHYLAGKDRQLLPSVPSLSSGAPIVAFPTGEEVSIPDLLHLLDNNRLHFSAYNMTLTSNVVSSTRGTAWGSDGDETITAEFSVTFASEEAARFFFNTGGEIRIGLEHPEDSTDQDAAWQEILNNLVVAFRANKSVRVGDSSGVAVAVGYYQLTTEYQDIYMGVNVGSGAYSSNDYLIEAKARSITGLNGAKGSELWFRVTLTDQHTNVFFDEVSAGTIAALSHLRANAVLPNLPAAPVCSVETDFDD